MMKSSYRSSGLAALFTYQLSLTLGVTMMTPLAACSANQGRFENAVWS